MVLYKQMDMIRHNAPRKKHSLPFLGQGKDQGNGRVCKLAMDFKPWIPFCCGYRNGEGLALLVRAS